MRATTRNRAHLGEGGAGETVGEALKAVDFPGLRGRRQFDERGIAAIRDGDARENYRVMLRFRDQLLAAPTLTVTVFEVAEVRPAEAKVRV